jgi:dephospho-CoA kinase
MRRNAFTREQALAIIARQATREARLAAAHDVVVNEHTSIEALTAEVLSLHRRYLALSQALPHGTQT